MKDEDAEGTVTGRFKKPNLPEMQFIKPPELSTHMLEIVETAMREMRAIVGIDLANHHDSMAAMLIRYVNGQIEVEHISTIQGIYPDFIVIDELSDIPTPNFAELEIRLLDSLGPCLDKTQYNHGSFKVDYDPELYRKKIDYVPKNKLRKQNGKDASYLALDPTKNHRKRRR